MQKALSEIHDFSTSAVAELAGADEGTRRLDKRISLHRLVVALVVLDTAGLFLLGLLPLGLRAHLRGLELPQAFDRVEGTGVVLGLALFVLCQRILGGYRTKSVIAGGWSTRRLVSALLATFSLLMVLAAASKTTDLYSRVWFFSWAGSALLVLQLLRLLLIENTRRALAHGAYVYRALSIGVLSPPLKQSEITRLSKSLTRARSPVRFDSIDNLMWLESQVRDGLFDEVYITVPWAKAPEVFQKLRELQHLSINVYVVPAETSLTGSLVGAQIRGDRLQIHMLDQPIEGWNLLQKRWSDILVAGLALLAFSPIMLIVAAAIKLESKGPVLFRQPRLGFNGRRFELLKFRSMYAERSDAGASVQTSRNDSRVTRVGRFIRRTSLDELPQLLNVLYGQMSIVGPRPHALATTAEGRALDQAVIDYAARHRVRPGMTGWAQVNGLRGELDTIDKLEKRVRFDIYYIEKWSLLFDLRILIRTLLVVLHDPKAY